MSETGGGEDANRAHEKEKTEKLAHELAVRISEIVDNQHGRITTSFDLAPHPGRHSASTLVGVSRGDEIIESPSENGVEDARHLVDGLVFDIQVSEFDKQRDLLQDLGYKGKRLTDELANAPHTEFSSARHEQIALSAARHNETVTFERTRIVGLAGQVPGCHQTVTRRDEQGDIIKQYTFREVVGKLVAVDFATAPEHDALAVEVRETFDSDEGLLSSLDAFFGGDSSKERVDAILERAWSTYGGTPRKLDLRRMMPKILKRVQAMQDADARPDAEELEKLKSYLTQF